MSNWCEVQRTYICLLKFFSIHTAEPNTGGAKISSYVVQMAASSHEGKQNKITLKSSQKKVMAGGILLSVTYLTVNIFAFLQNLYKNFL